MAKPEYLSQEDWDLIIQNNTAYWNFQYWIYQYYIKKNQEADNKLKDIISELKRLKS